MYESVTGLPTALFTLGSAGAALLVGRIFSEVRTAFRTYSRIFGWSIGAIGVIILALISSIILLFTLLLIYGAGKATNLKARYAGTDLANSTQRATIPDIPPPNAPDNAIQTSTAPCVLAQVDGEVVSTRMALPLIKPKFQPRSSKASAIIRTIIELQ